MLDEAEYASDTDESDEDYKPAGEGSDVASEVESDGEAENDNDNDAETQRGRRKRRAPQEIPSENKRNRRSNELESSKSTEKDALDDDDDNDENEDALWASFLSGAGQTASKPNPQSKSISSTSNGNAKQPENSKPQKPTQSTEQKKVVTEIFEFAGEKVEVKKEITIREEEKKKPSSEQCPGKSNSSTATQSAVKSVTIPPLNRARPGNVGGGSSSGSGGLSSVLNQLGKKNQLSVLEKSKLDWNGFKRNQGIDEELQTHNKGRDGYLERQDFLQRTDLRQFELEKNMRHANRRK